MGKKISLLELFYHENEFDTNCVVFEKYSRNEICCGFKNWQ